MMRKIIFFCLLISTSLINCKTEKTTEKIPEEKVEKNAIFPDDFLGEYKGNLHIESVKGTQVIPMEYHLHKTDSINKFNYKLIYNGQARNYTLIIKNKEKGLLEVDENNGIILPTKFANNTLYSFFEVQGNFLSTRFSFKENTLDFEILFTKMKQKVKSGGISKEIPEVFGYPISTVQKAILTKK